MSSYERQTNDLGALRRRLCHYLLRVCLFEKQRLLQVQSFPYKQAIDH
jgi:hypothetical protein